MIKKPMMAKRTTKAAPAKKKTVAAKKKTVAAKKPMTVAGKTVKKYQVGGPAMGSPRANPTATVGMQRPTITPGMTAPQMRQAYGQSAGMNRAEAQRRNASMATPAARSASGGFLGGMLARQGMTPRPGMGGSMIANNGGGMIPNNAGGMGGGMMSPPNSRPNVPGITPPMNRPVRTPPPRQGMQGMDPAMQQYAQMMQRRQGMPQQGQMPPMAQGMQGLGAAQGMNPDAQPQVGYYSGTLGQPLTFNQGPMPQQGMQGMSAARGMDPDAQQRFEALMRQQMLGLQSDPARGYNSGMNLPQPQQRGTLTAADEQMFPGISNASNQAPARFRKGGEAKKKAAAQGRMAKPAGRGRTTKPAVRGRMAKPTRGKK